MSGSKNKSIKTLSFDIVKNAEDGTKFYQELLDDVKYFDTLLKKFDDKEAKQAQYGKDENKSRESNSNESNQNQIVIQDNRNSKSSESNPNEGNQSQYVNDDIDSSKIGESPNDTILQKVKKEITTNKNDESPNESNSNQLDKKEITTNKNDESPNESKKQNSTNKSAKSGSNKAKQKNRQNKSAQIEPKEDLKKIKNLKDKCPIEKKCIIKLLKSSIEEFYKKKLNNSFDNIDNVFGKLKNKFDDFVFEDKCIELLKSKYNLKEFDAFPYFKKIKTKTGDFIIQINFFFINVKVRKVIKNYFFFEEAGELFPINYNDNYIRFYALIEMDKNKQKGNITYYFQDYNFLIRDELKFENNIFTSILKEGQLEENYLIKEKKIMENQYKLFDLKEDNQNENNKNKIKAIEDEINKLRKEQNGILDKKGNSIIEIQIIKNVREIDGFFQTKENIIIENSAYKFEIKAKSFLVVEVKNYNKFQEIIKNISLKKEILSKLGINSKKLYFIGILFDVEEKELKNNQTELINNNICIITGKDLLKKNENLYENNQPNNYTLELKINNLEKKMDHIESQINDIKSDIKSTMEIILNQIKEIRNQGVNGEKNLKEKEKGK